MSGTKLHALLQCCSDPPAAFAHNVASITASERHTSNMRVSQVTKVEGQPALRRAPEVPSESHDYAAEALSFMPRLTEKPILGMAQVEGHLGCTLEGMPWKHGQVAKVLAEPGSQTWIMFGPVSGAGRCVKASQLSTPLSSTVATLHQR